MTDLSLLSRQPPDDWERLERMAEAVADAVDAKGGYSPSHCRGVAKLCVLIGRNMNIRGHALDRLRVAGLLHDAGKLQTPDALLLKPGALTVFEYEVVKRHSLNGYELLEGLGLHDEARWVLHHHERVDGLGYPTGLLGAAIPTASRIIAVADAFECMTAARVYTPAKPRVWALNELFACAGTQFDRAVVHALATSLI